ncbi:dienelactone hydrolase [Westerdykella ornata]|uniref:Dienelactone hydrolase n=1 Tax=Westerdykella ornata TaxID=318751 RepID=A0A6A6JG58_WESOR|nr:dienelactone hydrolase [Westerdykella ornata]KAF2274189.1 dienelactone hydrolase [Westerdykella ornata]
MATMPATHGHNESCCNIPPVVSEDYVPKGTYKQLGGMNTYVTGSDEATKGIVSIFDIFGFATQTLQGADILAESNRNQSYKVFIPDWFHGNPVPNELFPPDTEEKQKQLGAWFANNDPHGVAAALPEYVKALQAANPSIKSWGILGFCWGGKVVELVTSSSSNPFTVAAVAHPAMIDPSSAEGISVPFIMLAAGEDPADAVEQFKNNLKVPNHVEIFGDQVHGWMAARADLSNARSKAEYARGYQTVLNFFGKQWQ